MQSDEYRIDLLERRLIGLEAAMRYERLPLYVRTAAAFQIAATRFEISVLKNPRVRESRNRKIVPLRTLN